MHKGAINRPKVILEGAGEAKSDVDDSVSGKREHVNFEELVEELLRLVHHLFAHNNEQLTSFVGGLLPRSEVVLHNLNDSFLLVTVALEFVQDRGERSGSGPGDHGDSVLAEFEEHGKELLVDDLLVEEGGEFTKVFGKHLLSSPVVAGTIKSLSNVLNIIRPFGLGHLSKQHVEVFHHSQSHIGVVVAQEFVSNTEKVTICQLSP